MTTPSNTKHKPGAQRLAERVVRLAQFGLAGLVAMLIAGLFGWWSAVLDLFSHFQVQYAFCALLALIVMALARRWFWALLAASLFVLCAARIAPMYIPGPVYAHGEQRDLRLLLMNIQKNNDRLDLVREAVTTYDPDIVIVQELTPEVLRVLQWLKRTHEYQFTRPREDHFGIALMSRIPWTRVSTSSLGPSQLPSLKAEFRVNGASVRLLTTHPLPPLPLGNTPSRNVQLTDVGLNMQAMMQEGPAILIGDLNVTPWSQNWYRLFGSRELHDARRGYGVLPTWSMHRPFFLRIPIDHCLVSEQWRVVDCTTGPDIGSDHRPLVVDLALRP